MPQHFRSTNQFAHHQADLPGFRAHYVREGSGPPLILLHGWPGFWWDWRHVIGLLSSRFDVIVPDLRGSGDSEKTDLDRIEDYAVGQLADDQVALMDALSIDKAFIVGHDFGSMALHKLVRRHPERVRRAVLFDPVLPTFTKSDGEYAQEDWYYLFSDTEVAPRLVASSREARRLYYQHFYDTWSNGRMNLSEAEFEIVIDNYMKPENVLGGMTYDRANLGAKSHPWDDNDHQISDVPVSVHWAENDPSVPPSAAKDLPALYSDYTLEMIPDCGHFVMLDQPAIVAERIIKSCT